LKVGRNYCLKKRRSIEMTRSHLQSRLAELPSISHANLDGAFYAFLQLPELDLNDMQIVEYLIEKHRVAVIPGTAFGITDRHCLRVSYGALESDTAVEGINRLFEGLKTLCG